MKENKETEEKLKITRENGEEMELEWIRQSNRGNSSQMKYLWISEKHRSISEIRRIFGDKVILEYALDGLRLEFQRVWKSLRNKDAFLKSIAGNLSGRKITSDSLIRKALAAKKNGNSKLAMELMSQANEMMLVDFAAAEKEEKEEKEKEEKEEEKEKEETK